jgi:hypothetical protein
MSLITKIQPYGIDVAINEIQTAIYNFLVDVNKVGWTEYESYPRVYKNKKGDDVLPEFYEGTNDYFEVLFNDKFKVTSFVLVDDVVNSSLNEGERVFTQRVSFIFQGLLDELYPTITHRADAEMHDDIFRAFDSTEYDVVSYQTGINNVYSDLTFASLLNEKVNLDDMSNFHFVRFDIEVPYTYDCKINLL